MRVDFKTGTFYVGDCLEIMPTLAAGSVDMILNDPPYGTTACAWDSILPIDEMWTAYWHTIKNINAVVLFSAQPFTSRLISSAYEFFKYSWVWEKSRPSGFAQAKNMPMKSHEDINVFSRGVTVHASQSIRRMPYFPQGVEKLDVPRVEEKKSWSDSSFAKRPSHKAYLQTDTNYPRSVIKIASESLTVHPTQKPVALFEYLIRTYTNPGELVLDNTAGSGTTAIAAMQSGRRWVCIEQNEIYANAALARIWDAEAVL